MTPAGPRFALGFSRVQGKVIVRIDGALDAASAPELRDRLRDLIEGQGNRQLVLDLTGTTGVDPTGLAVLVGALQRLHTAGGELVLTGLPDAVADSLAAVGLDRVFAVEAATAGLPNETDEAVDRLAGRG